jgi:putative membrane protein
MDDAAIREIRRPHKNLFSYYVLVALATTVAFPFVFPPLLFKYITLRYTIDDEGVSAKWGILFRREVYLTYKRIQDIHVRRNVVERWLGIGTVDIQTASGSSTAELKLEGMSDYSAVRDFLYRRMRGHDLEASGEPAAAPARPAADVRIVELLGEIKEEIEATRQALETRRG